jgi:perosamine synthetase
MNMNEAPKFQKLLNLIKKINGNQNLIPLHSPLFIGNEKKYLIDAINSTYVSSVGPLVQSFEHQLSKFTGIKYCSTTVNGTSALHIALKAIDVRENMEVLTQSLTFVATVNAIKYCNADPVFIDVDLNTLGMSSRSLQSFLDENCEVRNDGKCWNKLTNKEVKAVLPMHTFGHPVDLKEIYKICKKYKLFLIEDAAESLGSYYRKKHTGHYGIISTLSFNGNKIITTGGGGAVLTNNKNLHLKISHMINTSKIKDKWNFFHNEVGYNYRMPNINAALGLAQLEKINIFLKSKRKTFENYKTFANDKNINLFSEPKNSKSNYWLNCLITDSENDKNTLLKMSHAQNIMMRPAWYPMHKLPMYKSNLRDNLKNTEYLFERIVCIPSSVIQYDQS